MIRFAPLALCIAAAVGAQSSSPRKSQLATVSQTVAGVNIEMLYRRPVARGRALFGTLVPWGKIWTPSADSAARFTVSAPITINGSALAAGTYSVWTIPDSASWTVIFSSTAAAFHLSYPTGHDVLRVRATPLRGDHVESLLFAFPMVDADSAQLQLHWGTTIVPLAIRTVP
ncbi:MAG: hypothetical protein JWM95_4171 [Gemmatimonadetes bacterium]|nr:hypothetical protein [Gemmatimonadota bacterium]